MSEDYTVITDSVDYSFNSDFLFAFCSISIFGYEPEFRFVYEEGDIPQMVWISLGCFARVHGRYVDIDRYVLEDDDIFDVEDEENPFRPQDLNSIPGEGC